VTRGHDLSFRPGQPACRGPSWAPAAERRSSHVRGLCPWCCRVGGSPCRSRAGAWSGPVPGGRGASRWVLPGGQRGLSAAAAGARWPHRGHRRLAACPETWPLCRRPSAAARGAGQMPRCPGLAPSRIRRWCAHRVPVDARDRVWAGCDTWPRRTRSACWPGFSFRQHDPIDLRWRRMRPETKVRVRDDNGSAAR
jgi:hypothetical protein